MIALPTPPSIVPPKDILQPVDWRTVDDAVVLWILDALEDLVQEKSVIWDNQKITQPPYPYISLLRNAEVDTGSLDEKRQRTLDADDKVVGEDPTAGAPVTNEEMTYQPVQWTLTIQAHADPDGGGNDPGCNPMFLIGRLKRSLDQTKHTDRFREAGVSIVDKLDVTDTSVVEGGVWISRATMDVILRTASVITERTGFIDKVELKSTQFDVDTVVDAS